MGGGSESSLFSSLVDTRDRDKARGMIKIVSGESRDIVVVSLASFLGLTSSSRQGNLIGVFNVNFSNYIVIFFFACCFFSL